MVAELLFLGGVGAAVAGVTYLVHYSAQEKRAQEKKRQEEESQFRAALVHELRKPGAAVFRLSEFSAKCEIPKDIADRVAEELYSGLYRKVIADGIVTAKEREKVAWLSAALELDVTRIGLIEQKVKEEKYEQAVNSVLDDGEITGEEAAELELLRQRLGISQREAFRLTSDVSRSAYLTTFRRIVRDGEVTPQEQAELLRCKQALAVSDDQASALIRAEALTLYSECFVSVIQDGIITPEEEQKLAWLQEWSGLKESDVASFHQRMVRVKQLAAYRQGNLPAVRTGTILEGGETCHWKSPCTFMYETRTRAVSVTGELLVTSKNLYFTSPAKSISYKPSRVLDIIRFSNGLEIKVNSRQGSGHYLVSGSECLEAILVGVVSKHKFLLSENYSSARTRHIPEDVKREVWDRDGGRCIRCNANDYLEFDHIIPHTRGGANTTNNVQLLCRKCNLLKSDRI